MTPLIVSERNARAVVESDPIDLPLKPFDIPKIFVLFEGAPHFRTSLIVPSVASVPEFVKKIF